MFVMPPDNLLIRELNPHAVSCLKDEMLENSCADVQPILCIVVLKEDQSFDSILKEAYLYNTIGGNHSRQALQELIKERPQLAINKQFTHRLCAVYKPMDVKLARHLASKHNRATSFSHDMTSWDRVSCL